ncbi:MAG: hypothetical protein OEW39_02720 [Deltaproteobacteria bacterium]|nr:hypothetical protein [Deltaproteobacteria bacterium]
MNRNWFFLLLLLGALFAQGCTTSLVSNADTDIAALKLGPLARNEYKILGPVEGKNCAYRAWLFPVFLPAMAIYGESRGLDHPFQGLVPIAREGAYLHAVQAMEKADTLIAPIYREEHFSVPPWFFQVCVTVSAKAIVILTDAELKK